jgi:hypothetical protein
MPHSPFDRVRKFLAFFAVTFTLVFVDVHFLSFFPLTVRDPLSARMSTIVAMLGGLCAGAYVTIKDAN